MGDLTVIILSIGMVILCWTIIRVNDKVDRHIARFKKFEKALKKNSTGKVRTTQNKEISSKINVPSAKTSMDVRSKNIQFIARK
ncbi:MAG: hypothetical protein B6D58_07550 [candidate division Zixibacteria bacterium 4484_95]|nr:MAG: hypothetical protein B6D58_07550 [candidate division Zixibacteria bacterium 4484_95]